MFWFSSENEGNRISLLIPQNSSFNQALFLEFYFLFDVTPWGLWPKSGLEFQDKSSVPNIKTFGLDPIILIIRKKFCAQFSSKKLELSAAE